MKRMGYALLLVASTLSAQLKPLQLFPPRSTPNSVTKQALDAAKLPPKITPVPQVTRSTPNGVTEHALDAANLLSNVTPQVSNCAIPLLKVPIPAGQNFTVQRIVPSPSMDPKIVVKPPLPACAPKP